MKPFLGIDLTTDKKNEKTNGNEFLIQTPSAALTRSLEDSSENAEETVEKAKLPLLLRIVQYFCGIAAVLLIGGILKADVSLAEGYQNAPWLFWFSGICAVIWLILWLIGKQKTKTVLEADESVRTFSHLDGVAAAIYNELSVPDNAKDVDVLFFFYKIKNGEIKLREKGMQIAEYFNPEFKIFTDEKYLYLANLDGKYAFPLSSIVKIHTVKKHIRILRWNKEEEYDKGIYKEYKLSEDNLGCIICKYYHILEVNHQGEIFGIYFPNYELPIFEEYINYNKVF